MEHIEHIAAIDLMTQIFKTNAESENKYLDIKESIETTWLPIFRSRQTLALAINAVRSALNEPGTDRLCDEYLLCLGAEQ